MTDVIRRVRATCDACASVGMCRIDDRTEAYVCAECDAHHERALLKAADAMAALRGWTPVHWPRAYDYARAAVDAYLLAMERQERALAD